MAPQEVILAAKLHPSEDLTVERVARELDEVDVRLRAELPEVGEVCIDVTDHGGTGRD